LSSFDLQKLNLEVSLEFKGLFKKFLEKLFSISSLDELLVDSLLLIN
jgi:hypothetical protein